MEFNRNCPECDVVIVYKTTWTRSGAIKKNSLCRSCVMKGSRNPFAGHKHSAQTKQILRAVDKSYTKTEKFSNAVKQSMIDINTAVDLMAIWTEKYGAVEAVIREQKRRNKLSISSSGENNPMFGKLAPFQAGVGIKGWYRDIFFRSLRELSFMLQLDRDGRIWRTAESSDFRVEYINYVGNRATYVADFIVDDRIIIECKPLYLQRTFTVMAKSAAMQAFCAEKGLEYQIVDPILISLDELFMLTQDNVVRLTDKSIEALNANASDLQRAFRQW